MLNGVGPEEKEIVGGGQNIEEQYEDEELQDLDDEMVQKLKEINQNELEVDEEKEEDEEDQYFDIDNLNDDEKAILMQYLQEEYEKNPDSLPMPKEQYEQLLADNQELLERMRSQEGINSSEIVVENDGAMIIQGENNIEQEDYGQEMNIEGGAQNIEADDYGEEEQQQPDYGEEEEDEQNPQIFNP